MKRFCPTKDGEDCVKIQKNVCLGGYIFGSSFLLSVWSIWDRSSQTITNNLSVTGSLDRPGLCPPPPFLLSICPFYSIFRKFYALFHRHSKLPKNLLRLLLFGVTGKGWPTCYTDPPLSFEMTASERVHECHSPYNT